MKVEFFRQNLDEADIENVTSVCRSIFLTAGPVTQRFEEAFSAYTGLDHTVGLNSCTAALHVSLLGMGIGPGDEVITPPMTFIASATAILHAGATPVFVDVEPETGLIDPAAVERAVTPRTRAILPVHLYGTLADMRRLREVADRHGLRIVEDCAHCIEGERDGVRPGQLGDVACYSFYATKNLTCGEGGAVSTRNQDLAERIRRLRLHGMSKDAAGRYTDRYRHWDMVELGWKYNMDDIRAALLVDQMDRIDALWARRDAVWRCYDAAFDSLEGLARPQVRGKSARHLYTIWVGRDRRDAILARLQEQGIGVAVNFRSIHTLTYFREAFGFEALDFPNAYEIGMKTISLPLYPKLSDAEIDWVIEAVRRAVKSPDTGGVGS